MGCSTTGPNAEKPSLVWLPMAPPVANGSAQAPTANSNQPASMNAADIPQLLDCLIAFLLPKRDAPPQKTITFIDR
jgi:hypothetical protein